MKQYRLAPQEMMPLAEGHGWCIAPDRITVDGNPVGYMYRESPDDEKDSGWRFMSGLETDEDLDDPERFGIFDVNTIANYDPGIIPHLETPAGCAFVRDPGTGEFQAVEFNAEE